MFKHSAERFSVFCTSFVWAKRKVPIMQQNIGASPSGKATDSDSVIRVFKSLRPSHLVADKATP